MGSRGRLRGTCCGQRGLTHADGGHCAVGTGELNWAQVQLTAEQPWCVQQFARCLRRYIREVEVVVPFRGFLGGVQWRGRMRLPLEVRWVVPMVWALEVRAVPSVHR